VTTIFMIFPKINWPNGIWWSDCRLRNGNFRWWNARNRLRNAVPAEFNHSIQPKTRRS